MIPQEVRHLLSAPEVHINSCFSGSSHGDGSEDMDVDEETEENTGLLQTFMSFLNEIELIDEEVDAFD